MTPNRPNPTTYFLLAILAIIFSFAIVIYSSSFISDLDNLKLTQSQATLGANRPHDPKQTPLELPSVSR